MVHFYSYSFNRLMIIVLYFKNTISISSKAVLNSSSSVSISGRAVSMSSRSAVSISGRSENNKICPPA